MAESLDALADPIAVKSWAFDDQKSWAAEYGRTLWQMCGDDSIAAAKDGTEKYKDRQKSWTVVFSEHESRITTDMQQVADGDSFREDELLERVERGLKAAYNDAS